MNNLEQLNLTGRVVVDPGDVYKGRHFQTCDTSMYWITNKAAKVTARLALRIRLSIRDQDKLESRPLA